MNKRCATCEDRMAAVAYLGRAQAAEYELSRYRAAFCPADCPSLVPSTSVNPFGHDCREHGERLHHLDAKAGRGVMRCQDCYLRKIDP